MARMTSVEMQHAISLTLGDHIKDFDIPGIEQEIRKQYGPLGSLDYVPSADYWAIVNAYDVSGKGK